MPSHGAMKKLQPKIKTTTEVSAVHHLQLMPSESGGLTVSHHAVENGPATATHHFGSSHEDGHTIVAHLAQHLGHGGLAEIGDAESEHDLAAAHDSANDEIDS
jgi:hypothetical protein